MGWFIILVLLMLVIYWGLNLKEKRGEPTTNNTTEEIDNSAPSRIGKYREKYKYTDVLIAGTEHQTIDFYELSLKQQLTFVHEPENEHDEKAIAILYGNTKLGYIQKGRLQDMILDFQNREEPIYAHLSKIDKDNRQIYIVLAFYKDPLEKLEESEFLITTLTRTSKKIDDVYNRQDNYGLTQVGALLDMDYDFDAQRYIVYNDMGGELGETNAKVTDKIEEMEDFYDIVAILEEVTESESGKYGAKVKIYFK